MAGDGQWVMDIVWHAMLIIWNVLADFWSTWSMELLLVTSFVMQLVLTFFAGLRWRGASDKLRGVIWLSYVSADYVAAAALGHLSLSVCGTSGGRQLIAFWAPFFLLHLGGPDSITAYELEDNKLSARSALGFGLRVAQAVFVVSRSIYGSRALVPAAWLMLLVGVAKYAERTLALRRANLGNVRTSIDRQQRWHEPSDDGDDSDSLLMRAHSNLDMCKHAIVDSYSLDTDAEISKRTTITMPMFDRRSLPKMTEVELSLLYDLLYTKAPVIHTWHGYCVRALSPLVVTAVLLLVEFSNKQGRHRRKQSDVVITRVLLVATLLLETASLVRALGSSWTGFLLYSRLPKGWIRHEAFCASRWPRFRRAVASLGRLAKVRSHRSWSGRMGQLNVLQLVTHEKQADELQFWGDAMRRSRSIVVIAEDVKELVFSCVTDKLNDFRLSLLKHAAPRMHWTDDQIKEAAKFRTKRGQQTLTKYHVEDDLRFSLGDVLQVGILIWHIGTDMYLLMSGKDLQATQGTRVAQKVRAIRTLSNYMMYLLAVRPDMLPDLVSRKLFELNCKDLARLWSEHGTPAAADDLRSSSGLGKVEAILPWNWKLFQLYNKHRPTSSSRNKQEELARMVSDPRYLDSHVSVNPYLVRGRELAKKLHDLEASRELDLVQLILEVWVDILFYAGYRCSKESHAKQLSEGGELITIVWLMAEHAGMFVIS
ncbi:hypothetical protein ACP4OV_029087 [Aristida adscensionis]